MIRKVARAKVNLTLRVLGRRPDGYHEIDSLIAFAEDACDILTFEPGTPIGVTASGPFAAAIQGENILVTALERLSGIAPELRLGGVHVEKQLPVAAGIGGGSADAGALLRAVAAANPDASEDIDWMAIAAALGADVPVCLANRPCSVTGLGERLEPLDEVPPLEAVLVNTLDDVPPDKTAQVFRLFPARPPTATGSGQPLSVPRHRHGLIAEISKVGNDLEPAALQAFPAIADVLSALRATEGCLYAAMSGAGPTCFGIFEDAGKAATNLAADRPGWWIRSTRL